MNRVDEIKAKWEEFAKQYWAGDVVDSHDELEEAVQLIPKLCAELEAYKRAKAENDERYMIERDEARAEVERLKELVDTQTCELLERDYQPIQIGECAPSPGYCVHDDLTELKQLKAERDSLQAQSAAMQKLARMVIDGSDDDAFWATNWKDVRKAAREALSPDAGRRLLSELEAARAVVEAARVAMHSFQWVRSKPWLELEEAFQAYDQAREGKTNG